MHVHVHMSQDFRSQHLAWDLTVVQHVHDSNADLLAALIALSSHILTHLQTVPICMLLTRVYFHKTPNIFKTVTQ